MTGYTVHTGTSRKFVSGWDRVFGTGASEEKSAAKTGKAKSGKKSSKKKGRK